jgi:hypothetical protein
VTPVPANTQSVETDATKSNGQDEVAPGNVSTKCVRQVVMSFQESRLVVRGFDAAYQCFRWIS